MPGRTIAVKLGGKERRLRYDLNAISLIGDRLELSGRLNNLAADLLGKPLPLSALRTIVWAGLVWDQPDLTEEDVGSWIDLDNFGEVWERFFTLFSGKSSASAKKTAGTIQDQVKTAVDELSASKT